MTSKAAKRQRKRARARVINLPHGDKFTIQATQGRRVDVEDARSATETAVKARLRLLAMSDTPDNQMASLAPENGCDVGRAIVANIKAPDDRRDMWQAVQHMRQVWAAHYRAIGAPTPHAQCLRILTPAEGVPDAMETHFDSRTPEERVRAASAAYMRVIGWLSLGSNADRSACISAVVHDEPLRDWLAVQRALRLVVKGLAGVK
jgi:hypothetical protein